MKAILGSIIAVFLITLLGCAPQKSTPIEGAWHVVSWEQMAGDSLISKFTRDYTGSEMKIWSKNHELFVGRYKKDTVFHDNCGGGTYKLDGNRYEETFLYFPDQKIVGTAQRLLLEIKNDTLIQTWPVDENWQVVKSKYNIQKLTRVE
jgi:hypothetical protein